VVARPGGTRLGCLASLIIVGSICYFGVNTGQHYWRYVEYRDRMQTEVRYGAHKPDSLIIQRLKAAADSLGLPESAQNVTVRRANNILFIHADYYEHVEFPGFIKEIHFTPSAMGPF
jgi:hypothetical protein